LYLAPAPVAILSVVAVPLAPMWFPAHTQILSHFIPYTLMDGARATPFESKATRCRYLSFDSNDVDRSFVC
jgi:hypothetical protein